MFLRFLSDGGTGLVTLGAPVGSRNRGFSLSFSVLVGYGCPKHTMFLYNFNRTLKKHSVFPFKLCFDVAGSFFESVCVFLGPLLGHFGRFCRPWAPLWPPCWPFWYNSSTISAFSTFHNFADLHEFLKTHHVS